MIANDINKCSWQLDGVVSTRHRNYLIAAETKDTANYIYLMLCFSYLILKTNIMNKLELLELGFKEIDHFTVNDTITYELGRNRFFSIACLTTPNEMMFIYEVDENDNKKINDTIIIHNYDYDGYLTFRKVILLINLIADDEHKIN